MLFAKHVEVNGTNTTFRHAGVALGADTTCQAAVGLCHGLFKCVHGLYFVKPVQSLVETDIGFPDPGCALDLPLTQFLIDFCLWYVGNAVVPGFSDIHFLTT